jgi:hypothetical protein
MDLDSLSKLLGAIAALVAIIAGIVAAVPPKKRWLRHNRRVRLRAHDCGFGGL